MMRLKKKEKKKKKPKMKDLSTSSSSDSTTLKSVIKTQAANGSFELKSLQLIVPKIKKEEITKSLKEMSITTINDKIELIFTTTIVLVIFTIKFGDQKTLWDLIATKARTWIKKEIINQQLGSELNFDNMATKLLDQFGIKA